ncbi:putative cytidine deaminase protein [Lasiodiplodia theobromae]|uniref:Cytidine deaminase n=1 Tax=Lasiodiplodia theobromae TaxID=45133 RepID=A0A5N5DIP0_9PEZI|nr:Cytidine deaminase [Lasiodiplodia theobromae]KAB2577756.1 Cytidine deaminase [Lasiodiplodia theobromae]KAF4537114.1 Cytidine deaminase [Lasiodiplodia theobromae]KAF9633642.1 putative cytidine deaminase protein [Lasiodiplodia theobromae]
MPAAEKGELIHGLTVKEVDALSKGCLEARQRAYCPYSQFRVGAALLIHPTSTSRFASTATPNADDAPQIILGANVENAAYPVGTCAERVAVGTAVTSFGYGRGDIKAVGVATDLREEHCSPCGMCRQFLREFLELDTPIFMHTSEGKYVVKTMGELLPMSFGPDVLPPPEKLLAQRQEQGNGAK